MADIAGLAASAAGGGIFGLIGSVIGRAAGLVERRQEQAQERARWEHEARMLDAQMRAKQQASEADLRLEDVAGGWRGLEASLAAEAAIGESYKWVQAVRGVMRPFLTLLLWLIIGMVFFGSGAAARGEIVETATFAATAATLWWFGDRGPRSDPR
ncbi:hypothetical protein [Hyphomonas chukchiensis]|uniref:Uncharacterized protein n=1 Tax=Hyphomonas chukchiensis TaxID=1280947 RepID=A0A062UNW0_9PROT|nr:hypothetical protein [Hyphomonas chukchiensis]KCZ58958.1 hypothetical protein HY30_04240 [Hyphomonas chukchiensis]